MIVEVKTYKQKEIFAKLGVDFSKKSHKGIPSFLKSELEMLDPSTNYILRLGGKIKCFLFQKSDKYLGRIAAIINPEIPGTGFFGLFDSVNDIAISHELMQAAKLFLIESGCKKIIGPLDFSIFKSYRLMTSGFDNETFIGEPRNPKYYPELFEKFGFKKFYQWESYFIDKESMQMIANDYLPQYELYKKLGYSFISMNEDNKHQIMESTYEILAKSYKVFPLFSNISKEDFLKEYSNMPDVMDRDCSLFYHNPKGEMIAFILVLKDITMALKKMNSKTNILSKIQFKLYENIGSIANLAHGGSLPVHLREALVRGKKEYGEALSLTAAGLHKSIDLALKSGKYNSSVVSLMREGAEIRTYFNDYKSSKSKYALYELKLS